MRNTRVFLLECKRNNIAPSHIAKNIKAVTFLQFQDHPFKNDTDKLVGRFSKPVLNLEIKITIWRIKQLEGECLRLKHDLGDNISPELMGDLGFKIREIQEGTFTRVKRHNRKKFNALLQNTSSVKVSTHHESVIHNFTSVVLPEEVKRVLCLESKFGLDVGDQSLPIPRIIKDMEVCIQSLSVNDTSPEDQGEARNVIRSQMVNIATNFQNRPKVSMNNQLAHDIRVTRRFLEDNNQVLLTRSDQGGATVLMFRDEYLRVMKEMLADKMTYRKTNKDPTSRFQTSANALVETLKKEGVVSDEKAKYLKTHNAVMLKMPVVSCVKAPSYKVGRFFHTLLSKVHKSSEVNIKNSQEFVEFARNTRLPEGYVLISLDVVSLFTNIPKELVIKIVEDNWEEWSSLVSASKEVVLSLIKYCFEASYFSFDNEIYCQLDRSGMGNPASTGLAGLVMNHVVSKVIGELPFVVPWIKVDVDDTILAVPKDRVEEVRERFNSVHDRIQFTVEQETNNVLCFLDVEVHRGEDGTLRTNWYQKPTSAGIVVNFRSNHPTSQKIGVVFRLLHRALGLSDQEFHDENVRKTRQLLGVRVRQHKNDGAPRKILKEEKTASAAHHFRPGHRFKFDETSVLDSEPDWKKRNIVEMIHIFLNDTVNKREDTQGLSNMYSNILRRFKRDGDK
ncbi:uncharacterized protein LOC107043495 [Diachasma alloeum]|uniref:uncharacterized protein LOC107043495 n=1 Tax=Diachasma alloeum TaxID=454923 RepID=UPI00073812B1|nr:uncharacterized protein LOC107043495 [Diachasma alloeum]